MQVSKWGNSLAVRLPSAVVEALRLKEGDDVRIEVADPGISASPATRHGATRWPRWNPWVGSCPRTTGSPATTPMSVGRERPLVP